MNIKVRGRKPELYTVKQILAAIKNSGGIKQNVAAKLGVSRHTITNYQRKHPTVAAAMKAERSIITDKAESNLFKKIQEGDVAISQWYLRYRGGYFEKMGLDANIDVKAKVKKDSKVKIDHKIIKLVGDALAAEPEEDNETEDT